MGLRAQATDQHREEPPPLYIRDSRPNPATVGVNQIDTGETGSLVDSFPENQPGWVLRTPVSGQVDCSKPEVVQHNS